LKKIIPVIFLFCFFAIGSWIRLSAQPNQTSSKKNHAAQKEQPAPITTFIDNEETANTPNKADENPPSFYASFKKPEGLLVIVGILTLLVLAYQGNEMRKATLAMLRQTFATEKAAEAAKSSAEAAFSTIGQMRDTAQRQLRAYVFVSSALLKFKEPGIPEVQVHFKNFGQTPAYDFRGWIGMYISDYPLAGSLPIAPHDLPKGVEPLPPDRSSIHVVLRDPPVLPEFVPLLGTTKGTIYVFGEMAYGDAFGNERFIRYRLIHGGYEGVRPVKNADGVITGYLLKADKEGNEAN
jgi:hypothetical protein